MAALERSLPGVSTVVELKMTSNWVFAEGVKPEGVAPWAWAMPTAVAAKIRDVEKCIVLVKLGKL